MQKRDDMIMNEVKDINGIEMYPYSTKYRDWHETSPMPQLKSGVNWSISWYPETTMPIMLRGKRHKASSWLPAS